MRPVSMIDGSCFGGFWGRWELVLRTKDVVKLRTAMGRAAARRAAANAVRWRNMVASIELCLCLE